MDLNISNPISRIMRNSMVKGQVLQEVSLYLNPS